MGSSGGEEGTGQTISHDTSTIVTQEGYLDRLVQPEAGSSTQGAELEKVVQTKACSATTRVKPKVTGVMVKGGEVRVPPACQGRI